MSSCAKFGFLFFFLDCVFFFFTTNTPITILLAPISLFLFGPPINHRQHHQYHHYCNQGLHELILEAVNACDQSLRPLLLSNIVLTGGCAKLPGLKERLVAELRPLAPSHCSIRVSAAERPTQRYTPEIVLFQNINVFRLRVTTGNRGARARNVQLERRSFRGSSIGVKSHCQGRKQQR